MIIHKFNKISAIYTTDERTGVTTFTVVPAGTEEKVKEEKLTCSFYPNFTHIIPDAMIQAAFSGDVLTSDLTAGLSLRNTETSIGLKLIKQDVIENENGKEVISYLEDKKRGTKATHHVFQKKGCEGLELYNTITNTSKNPKTLEFIDTFSLDCLSPYMLDNDPDNLIMHRIRNNWSGEGRLDSLPISHFNMECSWSHLGARYERFGQVGTMTARQFIPFVALEDKINKVVWAVSMESPMSWQMECGHRNLAMHLSGGIADYNYGHWRKELKKGETFKTHKAFVSAVQGDLLDACRIVTETTASYRNYPQSEEDMPILYNEYMYSDGNPTIELVKEQLDVCKKLGADYFVVDAGWYTDPESITWNVQGDWDVNKKRFPKGLTELNEVCAKENMLTGVWFEFENVNVDSKLYKNKKDWLLTLDGKIIRHGNTCFLDFRKPEVIEYLTKKVITQVKKSGLKYMKVDYNENVGIGVDGAESIGEGLRQHIEGVKAFYEKIKAEIPDLVLEMCSSGGMRHEPMFSSFGSMVSFSDLHFVPEGAVSACDLHRVFLPRNMQVWATMYTHYDEERTIYTMAEGMLGRLCLSGKISALGDNIIKLIKEGCDFYKDIKHIIKDGNTIDINTSKVTSLRNIHNAFSLTRVSKDGDSALFYAFRVNGTEKTIVGTLPANYEVAKVYGNGKVKVKGKKVIVKPTKTNTFATVVLLKKVK
ncbi:MAG: alpha-galactosidase [Clostridia bacterium]|nr:alpha-galactosidase [Clostridia bacterium]